MQHINTKKYKLYKSLYDMVTYKIRAHSAPSTPEGKDDVNSNPEEDKESDHLSQEREEDFPLSQGKTLEQRQYEEDLPKVLSEAEANL